MYQNNFRSFLNLNNDEETSNKAPPVFHILMLIVYIRNNVPGIKLKWYSQKLNRKLVKHKENYN